MLTITIDARSIVLVANAYAQAGIAAPIAIARALIWTGNKAPRNLNSTPLTLYVKKEVPRTVLSCAADYCICSAHFFNLPRLALARATSVPEYSPNQFMQPARGAALRSNNVFSVEI
jgi:hypothetical protein